MGHYEGDWTCKECGEAIPTGLDGVGVISGRGVAVCRECSINYLKQFVELAKGGSFDFLFEEQELPTVEAQSGIDIDATGSGDHIAVVSGTELLAVTPMTARNSGTAQAGAATTITLASGASAVDDEYNGAIVEILSGTGSGQRRTITDYVGSTKVATVNSAWSSNPDDTSVYVVRGQLFTSGNTADVDAVDIVEISDPS